MLHRSAHADHVTALNDPGAVPRAPREHPGEGQDRLLGSHWRNGHNPSAPRTRFFRAPRPWIDC